MKDSSIEVIDFQGIVPSLTHYPFSAINYRMLNGDLGMVSYLL